MPRVHPNNIETAQSRKKLFWSVGILIVACVIITTIILLILLIKPKSSGHINDKPVTLNTTTNIPISHTTQSTTTSSLTNDLSPTSTINPSSYWTLDSFLITGRTLHRIALLENGKVIIVGGTVNNNFTSTCEFYSVLTGWRTAPSMKRKRAYHTLTPFDNNTKLLATGGTGSLCEETAEVFDSVTDTWTLTSTNMSIRRCSHTATLLGNGQILIAGGGHQSDPQLSSVELYTPSTNSFTNTTDMNAKRSYFTSTLLSDNSTVLVTGGAGSNAIQTAELYINGSWMFIKEHMMFPRVSHAAVLLNDGNVLIAGGSNGGTVSYASAEIYNTTADTFIAVEPMKYTRAFFTLTLLPSGKVLATGGIDWVTKTHQQVCEIYDPETRSWSVTHLLNYGRADHQNVLLNDSVLTVGGLDAHRDRLASCEKYYF